MFSKCRPVFQLVSNKNGKQLPFIWSRNCLPSCSTFSSQCDQDSFGNLNKPLEYQIKQKNARNVKYPSTSSGTKQNEGVFSANSINRRTTYDKANQHNKQQHYDSGWTPKQDSSAPSATSFNKSLQYDKVNSQNKQQAYSTSPKLDWKPTKETRISLNTKSDNTAFSANSRRAKKNEVYLQNKLPPYNRNPNFDLESTKPWNSFGDLAENDPNYRTASKAEINIADDMDCVPSESFKALDVKRKRFIDYAEDIKKFSREGKLKEAIELFDSLADLGVTYQKKQFLYSVIISACGKKGFTEKAFKIYAQMRVRDVKPTPAVLTGLFNSCAECPFPEYGLEKAQNLHRKMQEEGWQPSQITYHAMIKAYGRCGYLAGAFLLVDEMKKGNFAITAETFSFLLQACASDKEAGFSHAIGVMRKMRAMKIKANNHNYNLLLRSVRDCGIGPPDISSKLLLEWTDKPRFASSTKKALASPNLQIETPTSARFEQMLASGTHALMALDTPISSCEKALAQTTQNTQLREVVIDVLSPIPINMSITALGEVKTSADRLALIGGSSRILDKLVNLGEKPNIKTATLLLECQDSSNNADMSLLKHMKEISVRPDVDFFNVMIKKRCSRWDYSSAVQVLDLITEHGLYPDVATFGTLAMSCKSKTLSDRLLKDMDNCGFRPNIKILGALMKNASIEMDFNWMKKIMQVSAEHNVKPCEIFLAQLEKAWKDAAYAEGLLEKGDKTVPAWAEKKNFLADYKRFCFGYKNWLKSVEVDLPEHPWNQFRPKPKTDMENSNANSFA